LAVTAVADLRSRRPSASAEELERFETDVLAALVLARSSAVLIQEQLTARAWVAVGTVWK
jgi:hypothetical protein